MQALPSLEDYLSCAVVWSEFAARNLGPKEVGALFGDIVKHTEGADPARSETISKVGNKYSVVHLVEYIFYQSRASDSEQGQLR